jgi:hypothetical protein
VEELPGTKQSLDSSDKTQETVDENWRVYCVCRDVTGFTIQLGSLALDTSCAGFGNVHSVVLDSDEAAGQSLDCD